MFDAHYGVYIENHRKLGFVIFRNLQEAVDGGSASNNWTDIQWYFTGSRFNSLSKVIRVTVSSFCM